MKNKPRPAITPEQALKNFQLLAELSAGSSYAEYRGAVDEICREVLSRGIADRRTPLLVTMLRHALAFIEHCHSHGDHPISEVDTISASTDDGPEMQCNLKAIRAALDMAAAE